MPTIPFVGANEIQVGYGGTHPGEAQKGFGNTPLDGVTPSHLRADVAPRETFQEGGDSGGPWAFSGALPAKAYDVAADVRTHNFFTAGVHQGGMNSDFGTRIDERGAIDDNLQFLLANGAIPIPKTIEIVHNLSADPGSLAPNMRQGILFKLTFPGPEYVFNVTLHEDDSFIDNAFDGLMVPGAVPLLDDLVGFGFAAGIQAGAPDGAAVYAWSLELTAAQMARYAEFGNITQQSLI